MRGRPGNAPNVFPEGALLQTPPLALYVHLPWCLRKCPYCDFNSHALRAELPEEEYLQALLADLEGDLPWVAGREVQSIFIGGGTPSLFSAHSIARLMDGIRARVGLCTGAEVTLEANPGAVDAQRFRGYREAGVNRLSLGIQSLCNETLRRLGRIHSAREALAAVDCARDAGFDNLNLDLMYGLPQQSVKAGAADLRQVLALEPSHISYYQLTVEPNTAFSRSPPVLPDEDTVELMRQQGTAMLADAGFEQYEVSAYARAGMRCRHNLNYWRYGDYLGIGAGAHGKVTDLGGKAILRLVKRRHPRAYVSAGAGGRAELRSVSGPDATFEFMLNGLRLTEGVPLELFEARTGNHRGSVLETLTKARDLGLLEPGEGRAVPSGLGRAFLNDLVALFLP